MKLKYNSEIIEIESTLPVIPLRDVVVFPHMIYPLLVGRKFTVKSLHKSLDRNKQILLVSQKRATDDYPKSGDLFEVGTVARILQVMKMPNDTFKVLVEGVLRAKIKNISKQNGMMSAEVELIAPDETPENREIEALSRNVTEQFTEYIRLNKRMPDEVLVSLASIEKYHQQADTIAAHILQKIETKQKLLEAFTVKKQFAILSDTLKEEIEILKIEQRIDGTVRESLSRNQREYYLQQQLKAIKDELGQFDEPGAELDDLYAKLETDEFPEEVKVKAEEELQKLSKMHPYSAEAAVVRGYVEWILGLPWNKTTEDRTDFKQVQAILDSDHYGLKKPKKRILEHLAVIKLSGKVKGPIICLVGPPGVGKTSIGKSVARSLGREFVRMSLGGVHDEAEIRGHRRTYIGAMPGRIIQAIKKAQSSNPVFLLDEIDKIGKDFRGDPASALLEVLDPEQNSTFTDNYLEVEFDLSKILFLTTANTTASIPPALRDRMEIIHLPGYLDFEKAAIAKTYLLPKLVKEFGLEKLTVDFKDDAMLKIIQDYTREAGVRELERQLSSILRQTAVKLAEGKRLRKLNVSSRNIFKYLGPARYSDKNIKLEPTLGYAIGLAWTDYGGVVLPVEVALLKGRAKLTMTGSIGEVMRESATAALAFIRQNYTQFGLKDNFFDRLELHVHLPEGAVPKDGPSAGVTMTAAILSKLTDIPVRTDVAMTGEITLTGDVLAIGGLNEKLLAAKRMGINEIILPEKNRKDISDIQKDLLSGLKLHFVRTIRDVLNLALTESPYVRKRARISRSGARSIGR